MSKLDNLQNKLDMWKRTATMYGSINVTLTPSDVVQLHQDVAVLYARIAKLETLVNDLIKAGQALTRVAEWRYTNLPELLAWDTLVENIYKEREQ